ncbi:JmjC domain-containing protein [Tistlia consotensis]|nr:cupin domain-containing protein [Tistlia consotensis]
MTRLEHLFFHGSEEGIRRIVGDVDIGAAIYAPGGAQSNLLVWQDWKRRVAILLENGDLRSYEFDLIVNGEAEHSRRLLSPDGSPSAKAVNEAVGAGATLRLFGVGRYDIECAEQVALLKHVFDMPVFANLYMTPPFVGGLQKHFDLDDSLVVQVYGRKTWLLYEGPEENPFPIDYTDVTADDIDSQETRRITLSAGDVLFVPQGIPHKAATEGEESIHIVFGIGVRRPLSDLRALLEEFCRQDPDARRPIRDGKPLPPGRAAQLTERFRNWLLANADCQADHQDGGS